MKKKHIVVIFEFFKDVDPERLENDLREKARRKEFPAFRKCTAMVHHKNLKQRGIIDDIPIAIVADDLKGDVSEIKP